MNALQSLIDSGIPRKMAERIILQATAEATPKKTKDARKFFPGMTTSKAKKEVEIECIVVCECCGATERTTKVIKSDIENPSAMKLPVRLCNQCPDYFRAMTHEQLVSLALIRHHEGLIQQHPRDKGQVAMAKKLSPEEVVNHRITSF